MLRALVLVSLFFGGILPVAGQAASSQSNLQSDREWTNLHAAVHHRPNNSIMVRAHRHESKR